MFERHSAGAVGFSAMAKRRFIAPARGDIGPARFSHPAYAGYADFRAWMESAQWPSLAALNDAFARVAPGENLRFVEQDRAMLADGQHYEQRIAQDGVIATRAGNWHDFFNALVWCRHPSLKRALNARQVAAIRDVGPSVRNRAQYALTQFDEAGVVVCVRDAALLRLWDAHDWEGLFWREREAWAQGRIRIAAVFGHALLEHALVPAQFLVGKCLVVMGHLGDAECERVLAQYIGQGTLLNDPLQSRPLPLAGVPGWHPDNRDVAFYRSAPCFQPLRSGRVYPAPVVA